MSGADPVFVDTNVVLYWLSSQDAVKNERATAWMDALWRCGAGRISWQVIHECYANAVRKLNVPAVRARTVVELLSEWQNTEAGLETIRRAWHWCDHAQLSYWDAMIVSAAERSSCLWLLSEDFEDARKFGRVTVVNPFRHDPSEIGVG
jgi:predicted nucleic acid-binding protein